MTETKKQKKLRIAIWIFYLIEVFLSSTPFMVGKVDGKTQSLTVLEIVVQPGFQYTADQGKLALFYSLFLIIPLIGFFFCVFDRKTNIKNGVSFICSVLGVSVITFGIGGAMASGALISLFIYLITALLSMYSIISFYSEKAKLKM